MLNLDPPAELGDSREARRRISTRWTARPATPGDAELLHVSQGTIVLEIVRTVMDSRGRVLKATTTLCPAAGTVLHHSYPVPRVAQIPEALGSSAGVRAPPPSHGW